MAFFNMGTRHINPNPNQHTPGGSKNALSPVGISQKRTASGARR